MTKDMQDLKSQRDNAMKVLNDLKNNNQVGSEEFSKKLNDVENIDKAIADLEKYEDLAKDEIASKTAPKAKFDGFKAIVDYLLHKVTDQSEQLVQGGTHGENVLIPEDVRLEINEAKKQWKSAKMLCTLVQTDSITGSFNFDKDPTKGLTSFNDGDDIASDDAPHFEARKWTIGYEGALLPVSNFLRDNERAGLMFYLRNWFAKKAIISENKKIFDAAKSNYNGGTPKEIADWKALKESINVDLDPAVTESVDFMIVTNQDGFNYFDQLLDANGRPMLEPDPTNPTKRLLFGHRIEVFSNALLPTAETKVPVIYGDIPSALYFIENPQYQLATDDGKGIGFSRNQTYWRVIEGNTVFGADTSTYVYGQLTVDGE